MTKMALKNPVPTTHCIYITTDARVVDGGFENVSTGEVTKALTQLIFYRKWAGMNQLAITDVKR